MTDPLGYGGLIVATIVSVAIVLSVLIHTLRQERTIDRKPAVEGTTPAAPPHAAMACPGCGQLNRVPLEATRALCGKCHQELMAAPVGESAEPAPRRA